MRSVRLGLFLLLALSGCGDTKVPSAPGNRQPDAGDDPYSRDASISGNGGRGGVGGRGAAGGGGTGGMVADAGPDLLAPSISFLSPTPATSPDSEDVITATTCTVRCKVEASTEMGAGKIDKSAVKIAIRHAENETTFIDGSVSAISDTEFEATFDVTDRPNGTLVFQCRAKDLKEHASSKELTTLIDLGPTIVLKKPQDKKRYALKTPMAIEFTVTPAPIAEGDKQADVKSVALNIGGVDVPVSESSDTPGLYQTSIDFSDKTKFPVQPDSVQLQVSATDARAPTPPTRVARASVTIDGTGPLIVVTSPGYGTIQRGVVSLAVTVTDPSGIKPDTLIATINTQPYASWAGTAPNFTQSFDTNQLDPNHELIQLTINITAIDDVGNKTDPPVAHIFRLDNLPPVISLDPPPLSESRESGKNVYCSQPFDPIGELAANDLDNVQSAKLFRALIEDRGNHAPGARFDYLSGTNPSSVEMYTQALTEYPLLVDTNADGICDAINKSDDMNIRNMQRVSPDKDPVKIKLEAVLPGGSSWFAAPGVPDTVTNPECPNDPGGSATAPPTLCTHSELTRVLPGRIQGKPPAVYGFTPSNSPDVGECDGGDWNIKGNTRGREGWICVAARAVDNIGNVGVSAPIRLCFDDGDSMNGPPNCSQDPPSCTGDCTITAAQNFAPMEIWPVQ